MNFRAFSIRWTVSLVLNVCVVAALSPNIVFGQSNKITVDISVLQITPEAEARIKRLIPENGFLKQGSEKVTLDSSTVNAETKNSATRILSVVSEGQPQSAFVDRDLAQAIFGIVRAADDCMRTKGEFGSPVDLPVYQVIEDGTIANNIATTTEQGIKLESTITINRVIELNTYTFEGSTKPQTFYLPFCRKRQIKISSKLKNGQFLLVESGHVTNGKSELMNSQTETPLSRVPYVNRLFKKSGTLKRIPDTKTFYLISARSR